MVARPLLPKALVEWALVAAVALAAGLAVARLGNPDDQLKAILVGVAGIGMAAAVLRPVVGLVLLLALAPFQYGLAAGGLEGGTNELLLLGVALILAWHIRARDVPPWALLGFGAIVVGGVLSLAVARDPGVAVWGPIRWTAAALVAFAAFGLLKDRPGASRHLVDVVAVTAVVASLAALAQKVGITWLVGPPYNSDRVDSFFGYYTNFAGFVAMAVVLGAAEALHSWQAGRHGRAVLHAAALPLLGLGLAVSLSRGGLLSVGCGLVALTILLSPRGALVAKAVALLVVLGVAGFLATPPETKTTFRQRFAQPYGTTTSDRQRAALQAAGLRAVQTKPLGLGYGGFADYVAREAPSRYADSSLYHSHRTPVQVGVEHGWPAIAGFLLLMLAPFALAVQAIAAGRWTIRGMGFVAATAGFLAQGMFDYLLQETAFLVLLPAFLIGAWLELRPRYGSSRAA